MTFMSCVRQTKALVGRELKHWYRSKVLLFVTFIQPLAWLGLFGFAMSGFVNKAIEGVDYFSFLAIGMIVMTSFTGSLNVGQSMIWDKRIGFMDKLLASPVPRGLIPLSKILANTIKSMIQCTIILIFATLLGLQYVGGFDIGGILILYTVILSVSLTFSSMFVLLGSVIKRQETFFGFMNLLNLPLMMASGIMFPTSAFPDWLMAVSNLNPLTYAADAVRRAAIDVPNSLISLPGISLEGDLLIVITVAICSTVLCMSIARRALKK